MINQPVQTTTAGCENSTQTVICDQRFDLGKLIGCVLLCTAGTGCVTQRPSVDICFVMRKYVVDFHIYLTE